MNNHHYLENSKYLGNCEIEGYEMYHLEYYPGIIKGKGRINDRGRVTRLSELAYNLIKTVKKQDANLILQQEQEIDELIAEFSE